MTGQTPIDTTFLAAQTFGDTQLEADLLVLFIEQARMLSLALQDDRPRPGAALPGALHKLKGSAQAIGAVPLARSLAGAEALLSSSSGPTDLSCSPAFDALRTRLDEACSFAASLLPPNRRAGLAKCSETG